MATFNRNNMLAIYQGGAKRAGFNANDRIFGEQGVDYPNVIDFSIFIEHFQIAGGPQPVGYGFSESHTAGSVTPQIWGINNVIQLNDELNNGVKQRAILHFENNAKHGTYDNLNILDIASGQNINFIWFTNVYVNSGNNLFFFNWNNQTRNMRATFS